MKERIYWLDGVKCLAICMVILAHVLWAEDQSTANYMPQSFITIHKMIATLGVPLFMMVSGALLFNKRYESRSDILAFYRRRLLPLVLTAEIWIVVYGLLSLQPFSLRELLLCMAFVHKPEVHIWYVRLIVIYYLLAPFLNMLRVRYKYMFGVLMLVIAMFTFVYNGWLVVKCDACPTSVSRSYFCYMVYMGVGYGLSRISFSRRRLCWAMASVFLGGYILYLSLMAHSYFLWYDHPLVAIMAFGLFYLVRSIFSQRKSHPLVVEMSKMSYGIYLSHFLLVYLVEYAMLNHQWSMGLFYMVFIFVAVVDIALIWMVNKLSKNLSSFTFRYE